jgi:hypothetical protein
MNRHARVSRPGQTPRSSPLRASSDDDASRSLANGFHANALDNEALSNTIPLPTTYATRRARRMHFKNEHAARLAQPCMLATQRQATRDRLVRPTAALKLRAVAAGLAVDENNVPHDIVGASRLSHTAPLMKQCAARPQLTVPLSTTTTTTTTTKAASTHTHGLDGRRVRPRRSRKSKLKSLKKATTTDAATCLNDDDIDHGGTGTNDATAYGAVVFDNGIGGGQCCASDNGDGGGEGTRAVTSPSDTSQSQMRGYSFMHALEHVDAQSCVAGDDALPVSPSSLASSSSALSESSSSNAKINVITVDASTPTTMSTPTPTPTRTSTVVPKVHHAGYSFISPPSPTGDDGEDVVASSSTLRFDAENSDPNTLFRVDDYVVRFEKAKKKVPGWWRRRRRAKKNGTTGAIGSVSKIDTARDERDADTVGVAAASLTADDNESISPIYACYANTAGDGALLFNTPGSAAAESALLSPSHTTATATSSSSSPSSISFDALLRSHGVRVNDDGTCVLPSKFDTATAAGRDNVALATNDGDGDGDSDVIGDNTGLDSSQRNHVMAGDTAPTWRCRWCRSCEIAAVALNAASSQADVAQLGCSTSDEFNGSPLCTCAFRRTIETRGDNTY